MYWQRKPDRVNDTMNLNNTYKLQLPKQGLLSSIMIRISGDEKTGLGSDGSGWRLIDFISQIQVVSGSMILKSLTGFELQALAVYDQNKVPPGDWRNYATNTQYETFLINFGRWLKDDQLGLDLSAYDTVELWITNNMSAAQFTNLAVTVVEYFMQQGMVSTWPGYLRTEEWKRWTTVADQWIYSDLPVELPIRRILLHAWPVLDGNYVAETNMFNLMDEVKFMLQTGAITVFDGSLDYLAREAYLDAPTPPMVGGWPYINNGKGIRMDLGYQLYGLVGGGSQAGTIMTIDPTIDSARSDYTQVGYAYQVDHPVGLFGVGMAPFNGVQIPCHNYDDPASYLDPNALKTVQVNIHTHNAASSAGGVNAIVLDRLQKQGS